MTLTNGEKAVKTTLISIFSNILLAFIKAISGIFGHSYALIADAIESTTDVFSSVLVLLGLKYANKPPDENHPYGHGKIEPLVTFLVVIFLITSAILISYQSIQNIRIPHKGPESWTLIVLGVIIIWKEMSYRFIVKKSIETNSTSLRAEAWHHRSDAITSVSGFIGISIAILMGDGYEAADDWAALLAAAFILYNSYLIFRPAFGEIMDEHLYDNLIEDIRKISENVDGIIGTEKCYIRKTGMKYHVDLHAIVNGDITVREGHVLSHILKDTLQSQLPSIENILIHIEPAETRE